MNTKQKRAKNENRHRIPDFENLEQEASWWETHNIAEYQDEFEIAELKVSNELTKTISVRMPPQAFNELKKKARVKGIGIGTLIRMWVLERLDKIEAKKAASKAA